MRDPFWERPASSLVPPAAPLGSQLPGEVPYYATFQPVKRGMDQVRETLAVLYRGKWFILVVFLVVLAAVYLYNSNVDPEYEAYTLVYVNTNAAAGVSDVFGMDGGGGLFRPSNARALSNEIVHLRQSQMMAEAVAEQLLTIRTTEASGEPLTVLYSEDGVLLPRGVIADRLQRRYLDILPEGEGLDYIRIEATSTLAGEASLLANLYAEAFENRTQETSRERLSASRSFLEEQEEKLAENLRQLEDEVSAYKSQQGAIALDTEANRLVDQLADLEAQRDQVRIEGQMKAASLASLEEELARIEPRLVDRMASRVEEDIARTQARIAELEVEREQILRLQSAQQPRTGTAGGPEAIEAELQQREAELTAYTRQYVDEMLQVGGIALTTEGDGLAEIANLNRQVVAERIAISGLEAQETVLDERITSYNTKLTRIPAQAVRLADLERRQQSTERMYLFIIERLHETRIAEESELGYAETIRWAKTPGSPVRPRTTQNMILGGLLGLLLGVGLTLLRNLLDNRIYRPEDLKAKGHTVLGVIPDTTRLIRDNFDGEETIRQDGRRISTSQIALLLPMSPIVETYRQVRTNIQFSLPDTVVQTLLITSSGAGEGKTTTATNLAIVMAQAGRKTLVIDADLRRPKVHKTLGLSREPGLVELLFHEEAFRPEPYETGIDNLYMITAGRSTPNASELLGSAKMRALLQQVRAVFDVIILDSPPLLAATDAALLATQCDATMMVVAAGQTQKHELEQSMDALKNVGARFIGSLLNGFDASMARGYQYRYAYYSKYGYGYGNTKDGYTPTQD